MCIQSHIYIYIYITNTCFGDTGLYLNHVNVKESEEGTRCETKGLIKIKDGKDMEKGGKEINVRKDQTCASASVSTR